jgi:hypothetical protein
MRVNLLNIIRKGQFESKSHGRHKEFMKELREFEGNRSGDQFYG